MCYRYIQTASWEQILELYQLPSRVRSLWHSKLDTNRALSEGSRAPDVQWRAPDRLDVLGSDARIQGSSKKGPSWHQCRGGDASHRLLLNLEGASLHRAR